MYIVIMLDIVPESWIGREKAKAIEETTCHRAMRELLPGAFLVPLGAWPFARRSEWGIGHRG